MKKLFVLFVFGIFTIGMAPVVFAQTQTTDNATGENILETSAGALPDSFFYGFKRFGEGVQLFFTFDNLEKAKLKYSLAQTRLAEAEAMAGLNKTQLAENALKEYETGLNETEADKNSLSAAGRNVSAIADLVGNNTYRHILVLQKVYEKVPDSAKAAIKKALENSMEKQQKIAERIAGNNTINITITVGNETVTRMVPAGFAEKFLEKAREAEKNAGEEVNIQNVEDLKQKLSEEVGIAKEKVSREISDTREKIAKVEGMNFTGVNQSTLDRILGEAKIHLANSEALFSQGKYRESYQQALAAGKVLDVAERLYKNAENIEKTIAEKMEIGKVKASEQIKSAREQINETGQKIASGSASYPAADKLLSQAKEHLSKAETAFNNTKYGDAFGQAVAAEQAAKNAERLITVKQKVEGKKENIKEIVSGKISENSRRINNTQTSNLTASSNNAE